MHPTLGGLFPLPPHSYLSFDSTFKTYLKFFHFSPSLIPPNLFKSTTISYWDSAIFPIISFPWIVSKLSKAKNQVIYLSCLKTPKSSSLNIEKYILSYFHRQRPILISVVSNYPIYCSLCFKYIWKVKTALAWGLLSLEYCQESSSPKLLCVTQIAAAMLLLQRGQTWPYKMKYSPVSTKYSCVSICIGIIVIWN